MQRPMLGNGFVVFVLFFGVAMLDAFRAGDWIGAAFWVAIGTAFLWMDRPRRVEG